MAKARKITETFWGLIDQADYDALGALFAPECEILYPGKASAFAGTYKGKAGAELLFKKLFVEVTRTATDVELLINDDKDNCISAVSESGLYKGKPYTLKWLLLLVTKGDFVVKAEIFTDTEQTAAIFPK